MTAVIGLLNKRGAVLAADSAVTRNRKKRKNEKATNNGNKMLRLSDKVPGVVTSVMIIGNTWFLDHPWDVIIRHYRRLRGNTVFKTLVENVEDFTDFLSSDINIWKDENDHKYIKEAISDILKHISTIIFEEAQKRDKNGELLNPEMYEKQFHAYLIDEKKEYDKKRKGVLFKDFDANEFINYAEKDFEEILNHQIYSRFNPWNSYCDPIILRKYKDSFLQLTLSRLTMEKEVNSTLLVFTGFGEEEKYPSLITLKICGGLVGRPVYFKDENHTVKISDDCPSAICRFAQTDVIDSILTETSYKWLNLLCYKFETLKWENFVEGLSKDPKVRKKLMEYGESCFDRLQKQFNRDLLNLKEKNEIKWTRKLEDYNLEDMAELALNLINITAFHRILTFEQEGVGGEIDRAVLTKERGFEWVHRKSWNHHQDVDGKYGPLGV